MSSTLEQYAKMLRKTTVYVVDDDPQVLKSVKKLLMPAKIRTKVFSRAEDFLGNYNAEEPACLVLDMWLPGMNGWQLQSLLAHNGHLIPIIFITDCVDVRMAVDAMKAGAKNILEKPFRPQELFDEIQKAIKAAIEAWEHREHAKRVENTLALLKPGQRKVIELVIKGKTNKEISSMLSLSVRGVEARRAKAKSILQVKTKAELVALLHPATLKTVHKT